MAEPNSTDQEIEAMRVVVAALEPLDGKSRGRVIRYLLDRLNLKAGPAPTNHDTDTDEEVAEPEIEPTEQPSDTGQRTEPKISGLKDIRSLVAEKRPKSAIEMATLVAYYLSELAPTKKETINVSDLARYFKQGAYPLPKIARFTLTNAKDQGLLETVARGEYKLTPVGHNLVAHKMPTTVAATPPASRTRPRRPNNRAKKPRT